MTKPIRPMKKNCVECKKKFERKRFPCGDLESTTTFNKRKFCSPECMANNFIGREKKSVLLRVGNARARRKIEVKECETCGKAENLDIHHKDNNLLNNYPYNLQVLCRSCHLKIHRNPKNYTQRNWKNYKNKKVSKLESIRTYKEHYELTVNFLKQKKLFSEYENWKANEFLSERAKCELVRKKGLGVEK